ncbi:alpha/beta fold hydrolase [Methylocaldum sp. GT1TLB]|uniref:alpha/beta fold hydrolase n=1 Tax=Methylocaldum sp. GT1TLB TaxID=3438965 RepID=UPI003DA10DA1
MPYVDSQGVRIHYQAEGEGPPLVLHHGFTSSSEAWRQFGYVRALCRDNRCILLDARGHGASDKPHDPAAYALPNRVADVVAVLDALKIPKANFLGFSMGGWIGFGMAKYAPERVDALLVVGAHPYADQSWDAFRHIDGADPGAFLTALESVLEQRIPPELRPLVLANDLRALAAAAQERPALEDVLPTMAMPCLLLVGEEDARYPAVRECAKHIAHAAFVPLPGLKHTESFVRSDLVLPHIKRFLETERRLPTQE